MLSRLFRPQPDLASLVLRLGLASIFIIHGSIKVLSTTPLLKQLDFTTQTVVGWLELVFGLALAVGLLSRLVAIGLIALQVGAISMVTGQNAITGPNVHRWGADYTTVGPEFNMILIFMALGVVILGSGTISLDHLICQRRRPPADTPAPPPAPAA